MSKTVEPNGPLRAALKKGDFKPTDPRATPAQRLAFLFNWMAENYPYQALPLAEVVQYVNFLRETPTRDSDDYKSFQKRIKYTRRLLLKNHSRGLKYFQGEFGGYRATVDEEDYIENSVHPKQRRVETAILTLRNDVDAFDTLVDQGKLDPAAEAARRLIQNRRLLEALQSDQIEQVLPSASLDLIAKLAAAASKSKERPRKSG